MTTPQLKIKSEEPLEGRSLEFAIKDIKAGLEKSCKEKPFVVVWPESLRVVLRELNWHRNRNKHLAEVVKDV
jgi:hypothetical protein